MKKILAAAVLAAVSFGAANAGTSAMDGLKDAAGPSFADRIANLPTQASLPPQYVPTFDLKELNDREYSPRYGAGRGYNVLVDDTFLVLTSRSVSPNPMDIVPLPAPPVTTLLFKCTGKECVQMKNYSEVETSPDKYTLRIVDKDHFVLINAREIRAYVFWQ